MLKANCKFINSLGMLILCQFRLNQSYCGVGKQHLVVETTVCRIGDDLLKAMGAKLPTHSEELIHAVIFLYKPF